MSDNRLTGSNHKTAARWNRGLVLRLLRQHGTLSRRQIAQMTGLRGSTLTYIVRELIERNILRTVGKMRSTSVGQKQVLLNLNPDLGYVLGIALRPTNAQLLLMDAAGNRLGLKRIAVSGPLESMPRQLRAGFDAWMAEITPPQGRLLGVGLGVPGVVDGEHGVVLKSVAFYAENVPLQQLLAQEFGDPVIIDHDACFGAVAEASDGAARDASHFVYFSSNFNRINDQNRLDSFGSALYLEGRVYRGANYAAGELAGLLRPRRDLIASEADLEAIADPQGPLTDMLQQMAESIGKTLASIINFLDVPLIVLGGNCNIASEAFVQAVHAQTAQMLLAVPGREIRMLASQVLGETVSRGAAITAVQTVLEGGWLLGPDLNPPVVLDALTREGIEAATPAS